MLAQVLVVDKSGMPREWTNTETGCCYIARNKVIWASDNIVKEYTGGHNCNGEISKISVPSILGVTGPVFGVDFLNKESLYAERGILYGRDLFLCAYCGDQFLPHQLTIDHVLPKSRGGKNLWTNTVTSCGTCNKRKADRTPEEAKMHLLYVPYVPSRFEKILLEGRNVLTDQMEFLLSRIPKTSRVWLSH